MGGQIKYFQIKTNQHKFKISTVFIFIPNLDEIPLMPKFLPIWAPAMSEKNMIFKLRSGSTSTVPASKSKTLSSIPQYQHQKNKDHHYQELFFS
jgi:hypothetical protein